MRLKFVLCLCPIFTWLTFSLQAQTTQEIKKTVNVREQNLDFQWFVSMHNYLAKLGTKGVLDPDPAAVETMDLHMTRQSLSNLLTTTWDNSHLVASRNHQIKHAPWPKNETKVFNAPNPKDSPALNALHEVVAAFDSYDSLRLDTLISAKAHTKTIHDQMLLAPAQNLARSEGEYPLTKLDLETPLRTAIQRWATVESIVFEKLGMIEPETKTSLAYATQLNQVLEQLLESGKELTEADKSYAISPLKLHFIQLLKYYTSNLGKEFKERDTFPSQVQIWRDKGNKTLTDLANSMTVLWNPTTTPDAFAKTIEGLNAQRKELGDHVVEARKILQLVQLQQQRESFFVDQLRQLIKRNRNAWFDELRAEASVFTVNQLAKYDTKFGLTEFPAAQAAEQFVNLGLSEKPSQVEAHLASLLSITNRVDTSLNSTTAEFNAITNRIDSKPIPFDALSKHLNDAIAIKTVDPTKPSLMVVRGLKLKMQGDYAVGVSGLNLLIACETLELDNVRTILAPGCTVTIVCHRISASSHAWTHLSCNNTGRLMIFASTVPDCLPLQLAGDSKLFTFETDGPNKKPWHTLQKSSQTNVSRFVTNFWADMTEHLISWYLDSPVSTDNLANIAAEVLNLPRTVALPNESSRRVDELRKQAAIRVYKDRVVPFYLPNEKTTIAALVRYQNGQLVAELMPTELTIQRTADGKLGTLSLQDSSALSLRLLIRPSVSEGMSQVAKRVLEERLPGVMVMDTDWRSLALRWLPLNLEGTEVKTDRPIAWDQSQQNTTIEFLLTDSRSASEFHRKLDKEMLFDCEVTASQTRAVIGRMRLPLRLMGKTDATSTRSELPALSELFSMACETNQKYSLALLNVDQVRFADEDNCIGCGPLVDLQNSWVEMRYLDSKNRSLPSGRRAFDELNGTFRLEVPAFEDHTVELEVNWIAKHGGASFKKIFTLPLQRADGAPVERLEITKSEMEEWLTTPTKVVSRD